MNIPEKLELPLVVKDTGGNEHEVDRIVYRLERNDKSRWYELFGTPEKAARTVAHNAPSTCDECIMIDMCDIGMPAACIVRDHDALLEWLRGDERCDRERALREADEIGLDMSGVTGHENRCGDWECPYSVCSGCPIAEALDYAGIDRTTSLAEVRKACDVYLYREEVAENGD